MRVISPEYTDVRHLGEGIRARGRLPAELAYFDGHFPGHPVLPGFVQLEWVLDFARRSLGAREAPCAFESLKFRSPLQPRDEFLLAVDGVGQRVDFELRCGERVVSSGRLRFDDGAKEPAADASVYERDETLPVLLPHMGRMRVIDAVLAHDERASLCEAVVGPETPLFDRDRASPALAVELLAQAMAAHGGLLARGGGAGAEVGFLVGSRRIELRTRGFRRGQRLWVRAEHLRGSRGLVAFECALGSGALPVDAEDARNRALAFGPLRAYIGVLEERGG